MKADYDYLSSVQHLLTDVPPHTHTHAYTVVCVCLRACNCIDTLFTIDFTRLHSRLFKEKNFLMPSSANKTHTRTHSHSHSYSHSHCHSHSLRVLHSRIFAQLRIHTFILELSSFIPSLSVAFSFHSLILHSIFPSRLACFFFFFLPLHICLNDLIFIFPMLADLFVLVMDMRLLKSLPPFRQRQPWHKKDKLRKNFYCSAA